MRRVVSKIVFAMDTKKHHLIPDSPSRTCFPGIIFKVMSISQKSSLRAEQFQPDIQHDPFPKATVEGLQRETALLYPQKK